jgi:hypothetical protein
MAAYADLFHDMGYYHMTQLANFTYEVNMTVQIEKPLGRLRLCVEVSLYKRVTS